MNPNFNELEDDNFLDEDDIMCLDILDTDSDHSEE